MTRPKPKYGKRTYLITSQHAQGNNSTCRFFSPACYTKLSFNAVMSPTFHVAHVSTNISSHINSCDVALMKFNI